MLQSFIARLGVAANVCLNGSLIFLHGLGLILRSAIRSLKTESNSRRRTPPYQRGFVHSGPRQLDRRSPYALHQLAFGASVRGDLAHLATEPDRVMRALVVGTRAHAFFFDFEARFFHSATEGMVGRR